MNKANGKDSIIENRVKIGSTAFELRKAVLPVFYSSSMGIVIVRLAM